MRNMPPAQELVAKGQPARAVSGDGTGFEVTFPDDLEKPSPAQADGGTHVASTAEVGRIRVQGYESKGRINKRIRIALEDPD
jgi:alanyl-tRNA synthetase